MPFLCPYVHSQKHCIDCFQLSIHVLMCSQVGNVVFRVFLSGQIPCVHNQLLIGSYLLFTMYSVNEPNRECCESRESILTCTISIESEYLCMCKIGAAQINLSACLSLSCLSLSLSRTHKWSSQHWLLLC